MGLHDQGTYVVHSQDRGGWLVLGIMVEQVSSNPSSSPFSFHSQTSAKGWDVGKLSKQLYQ